MESLRLQNDGVDIDSSSYVLIEDSTFRTGDDVAIKSGRDREGRDLARPSENIVIRNNNCLEVHNGMAIGSEMSGSVRNVFVENCKIKSGRNLIYFKSNLDRGGLIENVHVRNIDVESERGFNTFSDGLSQLSRWSSPSDFSQFPHREYHLQGNQDGN